MQLGALSQLNMKYFLTLLEADKVKVKDEFKEEFIETTEFLN